MADWLASTWMLAMLALLALSCVRGGSWRKARVWAALVGTSGAAWLVTPEYGSTPFLAYAILSLCGGGLVAIPPIGLPQKAIGHIFIVMALFHFGAFWGGERIAPSPYYDMLNIMGWAQFAILLAWTLNDGFGKALWVHRDGARHQGGLVNAKQKGE